MAEKSIGVSKATHKRLAEYCGKLTTYDEGINKLIEESESLYKLVLYLTQGHLPKMTVEEIGEICGW